MSASAGWSTTDRPGSDFAERHAEVVFDLLPPDAALFVYGDAIGPLGYYRFVEGRRLHITAAPEPVFLLAAADLYPTGVRYREDRITRGLAAQATERPSAPAKPRSRAARRRWRRALARKGGRA